MATSSTELDKIAAKDGQKLIEIYRSMHKTYGPVVAISIMTAAFAECAVMANFDRHRCIEAFNIQYDESEKTPRSSRH